MNKYRYALLVLSTLFPLIATSKDSTTNNDRNLSRLVHSIIVDKECKIDFNIENKKSKVTPGSIWFWYTVKNNSKVLDVSFVSATFSIKERGRTFSGDVVFSKQPDHGEESRFEGMIKTDQDGPYGQQNDKITFSKFKIKELDVVDSRTGLDLRVSKEKELLDYCEFRIKYTIN